MAFRPALRPGAPLLRRDATHLQVGTSPGVVLADRPGLLALLRLLDGSRDVARLEQLAPGRCPELAGQVAAVLLELRAAGAVVDGSTPGSAPVTYAVEVVHDPTSAPLAEVTTTLLQRSGIVRSGDPGLLVLVSTGEPPRAALDRAALLGLDHLPVVVLEDRVRIGPLVRPGTTPCVGCQDRHRADWDPAWPAILHQLDHAAVRVPAPSVTPLTVHAAAVEVAAEVLACAAGGRARTTGRCLVVGPAHDARSWTPVPFHPACSCDLLHAA